ncbi:MAG: hypothetical protein MK438_12895, partial [SAR324 cluster bacterium]|nr:hypothetical protein [SAR324 cluster bacterium]
PIALNGFPRLGKPISANDGKFGKGGKLILGNLIPPKDEANPLAALFKRLAVVSANPPNMFCIPVRFGTCGVGISIKNGN